MSPLTFNKDQHIKYWLRCLHSLLPNDYTSTDSTRIALGYFILSSLDLLSSPSTSSSSTAPSLIPASEITHIQQWILSLQHPAGGFCGSPNHCYPSSMYRVSRNSQATGGAEQMDPASLPATFFALLSLAIVGNVAGIGEDGRRKTLAWLRRMQRGDGSFGEVLGASGKVKGGRDMRYSYFAAAVRWILRGQENIGVDDIDVEALVGHIRGAQTFDGGLGESSEHESHAGYTYCGIAALACLERLPRPTKSDTLESGLTNVSDTIRWLLSRQIQYEGRKEEEDDKKSKGMSFCPGNGHEDIPSLEALSLDDLLCVGCNGRLNKRPDTCYSWWVGGSLEMLGEGKLISEDGNRTFLLEETQHRIGGFGKEPGYPPDLYHSYLGLTTLAMMKEPGLKEVDPILCISRERRAKIANDMQEHFEKNDAVNLLYDDLFRMNSPGKETTGPDAEPPQWWKDSAKAYLEKEDVAIRRSPQHIARMAKDRLGASS